MKAMLFSSLLRITMTNSSMIRCMGVTFKGLSPCKQKNMFKFVIALHGIRLRGVEPMQRSMSNLIAPIS